MIQFFSPAFMPPKEVVELAYQIVEEVRAGIYGRLADEQDGTVKLLCAAALAGDGDHLEIGTLFGGSAVAAALIKGRLGLAGKVVCVDPLDGYYLGTPYATKNDCLTNIPINPEAVWENARRFGVEGRIEIVRKRSHPWPEELLGRKFASAYIDGDHWGQGPWRDWENTSPATGRFIVFDNYDHKHPAVIEACHKAMADPAWRQVYAGGITCILERMP